MDTHWGFPGIENSELICLGLPDKQSFCPKSGLCLCFSRWGEDRRKQLAGRKFDPRVGAGRLSLPLEWGEGWGRGGAELVELEILLRAGRGGDMKAPLGSRARVAPCHPQRAADVTEGAARGGGSDLLAYCWARSEFSCRHIPSRSQPRLQERWVVVVVVKWAGWSRSPASGF